MSDFGVVIFYTHSAGNRNHESLLGQSGASSASVGNGRIQDDNKEENGIAGY